MTQDFSHASAQPSGLNLPLIEKRMGEAGVSQADIAQKCDVSREAVSAWLQGKHLPRPRHLLQLAMLLGLTYEQILDLPEPEVEEVCVAVGCRGRSPKEFVERGLESAYALKNVSHWLPSKPLFEVPRVSEPKHATQQLDAVAAAARVQLGLQKDDVLNASHFLHLLQGLGAIVSPSLRTDVGAEHWTLVTNLPTYGNRLFVYYALLGSEQERLRGLAEAYGVCLVTHVMSPAASRRYARALASRLLDERSIDDLFPKLEPVSVWAYVERARAMGMGAVMDAIEGFQVYEGGRNHSMCMDALRVYLSDAYAISAELLPRVRELMRREEAQATESAT